MKFALLKTLFLAFVSGGSVLLIQFLFQNLDMHPGWIILSVTWVSAAFVYACATVFTGLEQKVEILGLKIEVLGLLKEIIDVRTDLKEQLENNLGLLKDRKAKEKAKDFPKVDKDNKCDDPNCLACHGTDEQKEKFSKMAKKIISDIFGENAPRNIEVIGIDMGKVGGDKTATVTAKKQKDGKVEIKEVKITGPGKGWAKWRKLSQDEKDKIRIGRLKGAYATKAKVTKK